MKKNARKLRLSRETLGSLTDQSLGAAVRRCQRHYRVLHKPDALRYELRVL